MIYAILRHKIEHVWAIRGRAEFEVDTVGRDMIAGKRAICKQDAII